MRKRNLMIITAATLAASAILTGPAVSENGSRDVLWPETGKIDVAQPGPGEQTTAILQYDDGVPLYRDLGNGPAPHVMLIGNYVNNGLLTADPVLPHSITAASVYLAGFYGSLFNMGFVHGPGHTAPFVMHADGRKFVNATAGGWNLVIFATPVVTSAPFLVGVGNTNFTPCATNPNLGSTCEGVALGTGVNGYGHNAMRIVIPDGSNTGQSYATIPNHNALIRLNIEIPVELMRFTVD